MRGQNDQIAGDVGSKQAVEAEKPDDVGGSGNQAQNERKGLTGEISCRGCYVQQTRTGGRANAHSGAPRAAGPSFIPLHLGRWWTEPE